MSSKSNIIVGLDIGTSNVSVAVADASDLSNIVLLGIGQAPSLGLRKGLVINIESTVESISKAVKEAEAVSGVEISAVYASVGGGHIRSFNSHGIVGVRGREVTSSDIDRVVEAAKAVAIPNDREILHVLPQDFIIDGQDGIKDPLGMSGVRLETHVHIVSGSIASTQNVVKCANRCGLTVKDIALSSLAAAEVVVSPEEKELGVCLIDIGGGTTDMIVFHKGAVMHTAVFPLGGSHLTSDIASGLRTPIIAAEEIKIKHGTASAQQVRTDEIIEVPSTGGRPARVLSKQVLCEIVQPRVEEIFTLAKRELSKAGSDEYLTGGVIVTGGGSSLKGVIDFAQGIFNLPIRMGRAHGFTSASPKWNETVARNDLITALGLVQYGVRAKMYNRYKPKRSGMMGKFLKKVNEWFGDPVE